MLADPTTGYVILKATEGLFWDDPDHDTFAGEVRAAGIPLGHYHFAWPGNPDSPDGRKDPEAEARHFLERAGVQRGDIVAGDWEWWGPKDQRADLFELAGGWAGIVDSILRWNRVVREATGASPLVYCPWDWVKGLRTTATVEQWAEIAGPGTLWLVDPWVAAGEHEPVDPKPGTTLGWKVAMHQWTSTPHDRDFMADPSVWARIAATESTGVTP